MNYRDYGSPNLPNKVTFIKSHHGVLIHPGWEMVADVSVRRIHDDMFGNLYADVLQWMLGGPKRTLDWDKNHVVVTSDTCWSSFSFELKGYPEPIKGPGLILARSTSKPPYLSAMYTAAEIRPLVTFLPPDVAKLEGGVIKRLSEDR